MSPVKETACFYLSSINKPTNLLTIGPTINTAGKATAKAKLQAFNHLKNKPSISPTLKMVITNDMKHDIKSAMKNENTTAVYFLCIKTKS